MTILRRIVSILDGLVHRNRVEAQLDDEMQAFIETSIAEKTRDGMSPAEARRRAHMELGGLEQVKEHVRTGRHGHLIEEFVRDLRYAVRMFARTPGFTFVVLLTLALGIGVNTAMFSLIDALMLRSLPVKNPQELQLLILRERASLNEGGENSFSVPIARALNDQRDIFAGAAGFTGQSFVVGAPGESVIVTGALVTGGFFKTLGLSAAAGRLLSEDDDVAGAPVVAVISDGYWQRQYGRRASALGQTVRLNDVLVTIVGVMPRGFVGAEVGAVSDIVTTVATTPQLHQSFIDLMGPGTFWLRVIARPAPGVSSALAASRLNARWAALADPLLSPDWNTTRRQAVTQSQFVFERGANGWSRLRASYEKPLTVLMAVAAVVLLIACANVASLFLARATTRLREMSVRLAIGAGRGRIVRQLLVEGTLLSSTGAALGIAVAWASGRLLVDMMSTSSDRLEFDLTPNSHVLMFSAALAIATGIVFGLVPALRVREAQPALTFKGDERTATRRSRLLPSLVVGQVALSLVLLAGASLFVRSLINLHTVNKGFNANGVLIASMDRDQQPVLAQVADALRGVPGVTHVAVTTSTPFDRWSWTEPIVPAGRPVPDTDNTRIVAAGAGLLETLQVPVSAGRTFEDRDIKGDAGVAIVNERYAAREFPGQRAVGQRLVGVVSGKNVSLEIIGVVGDTRTDSVRDVPPPTVYLPYPHFGSRFPPSLVIRAGDAGGVSIELIRRTIQAQLTNKPAQVHALALQVKETMVQDDMLATLAGAFGGLALVLCAVGLYGLLAYGVAQRSKEIGIRMALGAHSTRIVTGVIGSACRLIAIGLALGIPAAWLASRSLRSMLFGLTPTDPLAMFAAIGLLVAAATVASYVPARRASRVDPLTALRHE